MSPHLADLLTQFLALRKSQGDPCQSANAAIAAFYDFLDRLEIEHCNFGGFAIAADGTPAVNQFSATRMSDGFIEEYVAEFSVDDYVLRRAEALTPHKAISKFETGLPVLDEIEAFHSPARRVQLECAQYGVEEGFALIGNTSLTRTSVVDGNARYFGFVFGGRSGTRSLLTTHGQTVEIAAFALLDQIMPQIEASIDGFSYNLSPRQRDILAGVAAGRQRQQIAHDLSISVPTVDAHLVGMRNRLGAQTLGEAVAKGYRYGIL